MSDAAHSPDAALTDAAQSDAGQADAAATPSPAAPPAASPPNAANADVECPLCGYNLRGLTEPRCPECGFTFTWDELLDPARRKHPYLFEHHPDRKIWSFFRTLLGGLRPRKFWSTLHPTQPSYPKRLVLYTMLCAMPLFLAGVGGGLVETIRGVRSYADIYADMEGTYCRAYGVSKIEDLPPNIRDEFQDFWPGPYSWESWREAFQMSDSAAGALSAAAAFGYMYLIFPALLVFRWSMRKAKIRTIHVFRCLVYSLDVMVWAALAAVVLVVIDAWTDVISDLIQRTEPVGLLVCIAIVALLPTPRLAAAYRRYLRFDHPFATVLAAQFIAFLVAVNFLVLSGLVR